MASPVTMPQLGETVVEGTITKWLKKEGDSVARDEPLFEISTDKVDTEVPSPLAGTVVAIKVPEGETVKVGTELAIIDAGGDGQVTAAPEPESEREPEPASLPEAEPAASSAAPPLEEQPEVSAGESPRSGILSPLVR